MKRKVIKTNYSTLPNCSINEDGSIDLTNFNLLNESEQVSVMSTWNQKQIMSYYMQNSISEEECFAPVLELIDDLEKLERNEHNF